MTEVRGPLSRGLGVALLTFGVGVVAAGDQHRQHGAHEHGHGRIGIAIEGREMVIEIEIPGVNVVGFEHAPETPQEHRTVEAALAVFRGPAMLFAMPTAAGCRAEHVEATLGGMEHDDEDHHDHDGHADAGGKDADAAGEHHEEEHSELHAEYHFVCDDPERLDRLRVAVFEHLRAAEELDVQVVTDLLQAEVELHPGDTTVELRR